MNKTHPRADPGRYDMNTIVGSHDLLFMVLDTLRYDVARDMLAEGGTPNLARILPGGEWEERHTPGNFTYAAHQAFFAGFLPTPAHQGLHPRLFAPRWPGSISTTSTTCVLDAPDLISGLAGRGYETVCIGGVDFFNLESPLGRVLPGYFARPHWDPSFGVDEPRSAEHQIALACRILQETPRDQRVFLFMNISAVHPPNRHYLSGAEHDHLLTHAAALEYVDHQLPPLFAALRERGPTFCIVCSDHGTAYGENGFWGHRLNHPVVNTVPYAEFLLDGSI